MTSRVENLGATLAKVRDGLADVLAELGGWIAPIPTAYFTSTAGMSVLHWPAPVAITIGVVVELLGVSSIATWLSLREWNVTHRDGSSRAPTWLASIVVGCYVFAIGALTVALKFRPDLAAYASLLLPLLSLAGMMTLALRAEHRRRLAGSPSAPVIAAPASVAEQVAPKQRVMAYFMENPHDTATAAAKMLAIPLSTVTKARRELLAEHAIPGDGEGGAA
jgi:hypothetical protein